MTVTEVAHPQIQCSRASAVASLSAWFQSRILSHQSQANEGALFGGTVSSRRIWQKRGRGAIGLRRLTSFFWWDFQFRMAADSGAGGCRVIRWCNRKSRVSTPSWLGWLVEFAGTVVDPAVLWLGVWRRCQDVQVGKALGCWCVLGASLGHRRSRGWNCERCE